MLEYLWLSATAWFMGFFPLFEIYLAIPSTMALGLGWLSAAFWSCLGNFMAIPFIVFFYNWLSKFQKIHTFFQKLARSKFSDRISKGSFLFILVATPLAGSWAIGVIGKLIGLDKKKLFLSSAISIGVYGLLIAILTELGIEFFS